MFCRAIQPASHTRILKYFASYLKFNSDSHMKFSCDGGNDRVHVSWNGYRYILRGKREAKKEDRKSGFHGGLLLSHPV